MVKDGKLNKYLDEAIQKGATSAKLIHPNTIVTAAWVRQKMLVWVYVQKSSFSLLSSTFSNSG